MNHNKSDEFSIMSKKLARSILSPMPWASREIARGILSPVQWARFGFISRRIARLRKTRKPSLLVISLPRSGSSWVGEVLGNASNSLYLREPLTQSHIASGGQLSFFEVLTNVPPYQYRRFADDAFMAFPAFRRHIVKYSHQWFLNDRCNRHLVVKEVNPLALDWLLNTYKPRVIFLLRHPAAVALSFFNLGWTDVQFHERFAKNRFSEMTFSESKTDANFWKQIGALQGATIQLALSALENYSDKKIVKYEALCANPLKVFRELFEFSDLCWDERIEKYIIEKSSEKHQNSNQAKAVYTTSRSSKQMINVWKDQITEPDMLLMRSAYLSFDVPFYPLSER